MTLLAVKCIRCNDSDLCFTISRINGETSMPITTESTTFTKDIQGRYLCNEINEVNAWQSGGGRPFDFIIVGGGTFGAAIAEHLWFRQKQTGGLRTLVVEAGPFTVPEHVQNVLRKAPS